VIVNQDQAGEQAWPALQDIDCLFVVKKPSKRPNGQWLGLKRKTNKLCDSSSIRVQGDESITESDSPA
jgi:hypothetical protein